MVKIVQQIFYFTVNTWIVIFRIEMKSFRGCWYGWKMGLITRKFICNITSMFAPMLIDEFSEDLCDFKNTSKAYKRPVFAWHIWRWSIQGHREFQNCYQLLRWNGLHKDNMRIYEAISWGALLISKDGIYPEGLIPGEDFPSFQDTQELFSKRDYALSLPDQGRSIAERTSEKLSRLFSKSQQWSKFQKVVNRLWQILYSSWLSYKSSATYATRAFQLNSNLYHSKLGRGQAWT